VKLFDTHVHLQKPAFDEKLERLLDDFAVEGGRYLVCNGTCQSDWQKIIDISDKYKNVIPFLGVHPWCAENISNDWLEVLRQYVNSKKTGIGEIGIDRLGEDADEKKREEVFRMQLELAQDKNLPVSVHCVRAWDMLLPILDDYASIEKIMVHNFSGNWQVAKSLVDRGIYISFSVSVMDKNRGKLRDALVKVPEDRLLIETDSPNIIHGNKMVDISAELKNILEIIANLRMQKTGKIEEVIFNNSLTFFSCLF
jgi:TatD DNase family protein